MSSYRLAVIPGDGIGPEITTQAIRVAMAAGDTVGVAFDTIDLDASAQRWLDTGVALPDDQYDSCAGADAIYLGAIGLPNARHPDGREVNGDVIQGLRMGLDLFAGMRPARTFPGVPPVLAKAPAIDYVVVRESVEGMFASSQHGGARVENQVVSDTMIITRPGTERVVRFAFELARSRHLAHPEREPRVMCADKSNAFASFAFFRTVFDEVAAEYPDVTPEYAYIDAMTTYQVLRPETLDVVVTENLLGDIISDLAGATVGGLGLAASGDIGLRNAVFQSAHGSAPDIAGRHLANPTAAIFSAALMLDWLGTQHKDRALTLAGQRVVAGIEAALSRPEARTRDLGGPASTEQAGDAVVSAIEAIAG